MKPSQLAALLDAARSGPEGFRNALGLLVALNHGLRLSELCALSPESVAGGELRFYRSKQTKVAARRLTVHPLMDDERADLEKLAEERKGKDSLFGLKHAMWDRIIKQAGARASLPPSLCHPHVLRHSCARLQVRKGIPLYDIQEWLGHKSMAVTSVYLVNSPSEAHQEIRTKMKDWRQQ